MGILGSVHVDPNLPDPELLRLFRQSVRRTFEAQIALEHEQSTVRRAAVVPRVRESVERARQVGLFTKAWLFGSYAWGQPGERSDVDILVADCSDTIGVASLVGRACGCDVHVVDWEEAPESLRARVLEEGVPL
jgi:predicted nucleotidyltransferase